MIRNSWNICSKFPLNPIEDDGSYRAAVEILDRLFARDDPRSPAELEYFRALAQTASEYEMITLASRNKRRAVNRLADGFLSRDSI